MAYVQVITRTNADLGVHHMRLGRGATHKHAARAMLQLLTRGAGQLNRKVLQGATVTVNHHGSVKRFAVSDDGTTFREIPVFGEAPDVGNSVDQRGKRCRLLALSGANQPPNPASVRLKRRDIDRK